jgi:hypothetical protein
MDDPVTLYRALVVNFFWQFGNNSVKNIAKIHSQALIK